MISRKIPYERLTNTRDMGGMKTKDGAVVRDGLLFRSGQLFDATDPDKEQLTTTLDLIVDFRSDQERIEKPDPELAGVVNLHIPILDIRAKGVTREKKTDEEATSMPPHNSEEEVKSSFYRVYGRFVESEFSRAQYEKFMRLVIDGQYEKILWHCTAGKDRTGFAAMILQRILGIEDDVIMEDYLSTNVHLMEELKLVKDMIRKREGEFTPEKERAIECLFGAEEEYLRTSWNKIDEMYGNFHNYLVEGLHITDAEQELLRERYLK